MQYLDAISKNDRMISVHFQGKPFNITVIQVYVLTSNDEEAEVEWFYEDLQDLLELTLPPKDVLSILGNWTENVGSQEIPGVTGKFGLGVQNEAGQRQIVLPGQQTGHSKHPLPTKKKRFYTWTSPGSQYGNQIERWRTSILSAKQDQELTVAQIMNSLLPNSGLN